MLTSQWLWCHVSIGARCGTPGHQQLPCWLHCDYDVMWVLAPDGRQDISNYHADSTVIMMSCEYWRQIDARASATPMLTPLWLWCHVSIGGRWTPGHQQLPCWFHCDYDVMWVMTPDRRQGISNYHADSTVIMLSHELCNAIRVIEETVRGK